MADTVDVGKVRFAFKRQSAVDVPASGAGAFGIECTPSQGMVTQAATIASQMIKRNKMKRRARRGSPKTTGAGESELITGCFEALGPYILGAEDWTDEQYFSNTELGSLTISGTGVTLTFAAGDLVTLGFVAGQFIMLEGMSVAGNNAKWVPIVSVGGANNRVITVPTGYLADNALDATFAISIARHVLTPTTYIDTPFSAEEYLGVDFDRSKYLTNARFNSLVFTESPTAFPKFAFGYAGRRMSMEDVGSSPVFTDPVTYPTGKSLILLDGGAFLNAEKRLDLTALTFGITAPISQTDVIGTLDGPPAKIGEFEFAGSVSGVVTDGDDFDDWDNDSDVSLLAHYKDKLNESGIGIYAGNLSYGGYGSPLGGAGDQIQTLPLYGGDDDRGDGYARTTFLISDLPELAAVNDS